MKVRIASVTRLMAVNEARRMAYLVMMGKNDSTRFIQEELVGVKCRWIRGFFSSHFLRSAVVGRVVVDHEVQLPTRIGCSDQLQELRLIKLDRFRPRIQRPPYAGQTLFRR